MSESAVAQLVLIGMFLGLLVFMALGAGVLLLSDSLRRSTLPRRFAPLAGLLGGVEPTWDGARATYQGAYLGRPVQVDLEGHTRHTSAEGVRFSTPIRQDAPLSLVPRRPAHWGPPPPRPQTGVEAVDTLYVLEVGEPERLNSLARRPGMAEWLSWGARNAVEVVVEAGRLSLFRRHHNNVQPDFLRHALDYLTALALALEAEPASP
jgi:hypothetical protein